ncbi:ATP-binding protein [Nocardia sp. NPDC004750]
MIFNDQNAEGILPAPAASFVGRQHELEKISLLLLQPAQLVTLTGPGGIGKTRLAAEAVRRYSRATCAQVYWVRLARLSRDSDVAALEEEIVRAAVDTDFSGRSSWELLVATFGGATAIGRQRRIVLVLDNCEHVLLSAAVVIDKLLTVVPQLTIVATSREPIGWADEYLINVRSLDMQQAVDLFRQQANLSGRPVMGGEQTALAATVCRRVDCNPLYIQLAAARLRHQPLSLILRGLTGRDDDTRLRWSHGPRFGADPRHRGVSDAITWSYELCTEKERLLFERMSVFAAGCDAIADGASGASGVIEVGVDLDAIEAICSDSYEVGNGEIANSGSDDNALGIEEIEDLLKSLVDHSLVTARITSTTVRYFLVESLRVYAQQRLRHRSTARVDEPTRMVDRHLCYYRDKITYAAANWFQSEGEGNLVNWARSAWVDIVTAIENSLETGKAEYGLQICLGLIALRMPLIRGTLQGMRQWTERCLHASRVPNTGLTDLHIEAMAAIAWLAMTQGQHDQAEVLLEDCVAACLSGNSGKMAWRDLVEVDIGLPAAVEFAWGLELLFVHADAGCVFVFTRACKKFGDLGNPGAAAMSELHAAMAAALLGTEQQALDRTQRFLDSAFGSKTLQGKSWAEQARAIALTRHGDPKEAMILGRSSLRFKLARGDQWGGMWVVVCRIWSLARLITDSLITGGKPDDDGLIALATEIAHLAGGVTTLRDKLGVDIDKLGPYGRETACAVAVARQLLGPINYAVAEIRGSRLSADDYGVQRLALGLLSFDERQPESIGEADPTAGWLRLTAAERQVGILAAAGWTNPAIAARRGSSVRTVDAQVASIRQKLVLTSREKIIEVIPRDVIDEVRLEATRRPRRGSGHSP